MKTLLNSALDSHISSGMEELNIWVAFKRFLNLLDNIFAAGLFSFFVAWTANYLGYNAELDLGSSISKSLTEIIPHSLTDTLYFLLYLCAFWRIVRVTKVMPFNRYVNKHILIVCAIIFVSTAFTIPAFIYGLEQRGIGLGQTEEEARIAENPYLVIGLRWGLFLTLFAYRRCILRYQISEWEVPNDYRSLYDEIQLKKMMKKRDEMIKRAEERAEALERERAQASGTEMGQATGRKKKKKRKK